jgi:hypothetical protein
VPQTTVATERGSVRYSSVCGGIWVIRRCTWYAANSGPHVCPGVTQHTGKVYSSLELKKFYKCLHYDIVHLIYIYVPS